MRKKSKKQSGALRWLFIVLGTAGVLDTLIISAVSNMNLGVLLPLIMGIPLLIYGIFFKCLSKRMKKGFGLFVKILFCAGYALFILLVVICSVFMGMAMTSQPEKNADAVIILGGGIREHYIPASLQSRLNIALEYLRENKNSLVVVSGGQGPDETMTEASAMADYLVKNGIGEKRILKEEKATSTYENFLFSKTLLDNRLKSGYNVVFVTNEFHIYRAGLTAEHAGLDAAGLAGPSPWYLFPNNYLREMLAILKTWVFGAESDMFNSLGV